MSRCFCPEKFSHHRRVAGISEIIVNAVADKIEKRGELGIADFFGLALFPFGDFIQESQNVICCDLIKLPITKLPAKFTEDYAVRPLRIFFLNLCGDIPSSICQLVKNSWSASFPLGFDNMGQHTISI